MNLPILNILGPSHFIAQFTSSLRLRYVVLHTIHATPTYVAQMPLFRSSQTPASPPPPPPTQTPSRSRTLFSRRNDYDRSTSPYENDYDDRRGRSGGFFSRRRSSSSSDGYGNGSRDLRNEPSIRAARQKVADAESYEREADGALNAARAAVREAREHVRLLEREALEE